MNCDPSDILTFTQALVGKKSVTIDTGVRYHFNCENHDNDDIRDISNPDGITVVDVKKFLEQLEKDVEYFANQGRSYFFEGHSLITNTTIQIHWGS
jgi:hypothetical protein